MVKRARAVSSQDQEHRHPGHGHEIERQENDKLDDLPQRKGRIDRARRGLAELFDRVVGVRMEDSLPADERFQPFIQQNRVKDVHLGLVDEEGFEQQRDYRGAFSQHQHGSIDPGPAALEDGEKRNLRQVGEDKQKRVGETG